MFNTPILLITFNRPEHTRRVLNVIMKLHPAVVYIFQDGPREGNENDVGNCAAVRQVITELAQVNGINLQTYYSEQNLGCGAGPMTGINWFFSQVNEGIVMEDDCLPHPDFFGYCAELLSRYRNENAVRFINATLYDERWQCEASYDFSHYMVTGAWAGWRRTWEGFDFDLHALNARKFRREVMRLTGNRGEANWWYSLVREVQQDRSKKSYWDYQMQIHLFRNRALTIHPRCNLVSNIGFDSAGTHTLGNEDGRGERPVFSILPLVHPANQIVDKTRDARCWAKAQSQGWWKDSVYFVYQYLLWSHGIGHSLLMVYKKHKGKGVNSRKV